MRGLVFVLLAVTLCGRAGYADDTAKAGDGAAGTVRVALETDRGTILVEVYPQSRAAFSTWRGLRPDVVAAGLLALRANRHSAAPALTLVG